VNSSTIVLYAYRRWKKVVYECNEYNQL